jgi:outer membrane protein OmpA-like peptidoglycan-associated protein
MGTIKLYSIDEKISTDDQRTISQLWFSQFQKDLKAGLNAPLIRKKERDNFVFEPVYFDYDESLLRAEHYDFLDRMIKVIKGHSDLRVKVTGHTDTDGSDAYNDELSKRRAQAIVDYFVQQGLSSDRLVFDFKGEKEPVDTNTTPEGKQRNRRVDFQFI